jgi:hypothetical protein
MDQDTWRFINTFAPWFSAVGTLTAVAISLYLARRSDLQKLEMRVGLRNVGVIPGHLLKDKPYTFFLRPNVISNQPPDLLVVSVTNVGRRTARLTHIYWQAGRGTNFLWTPMRNDYSFDFPPKEPLADGEQAFYSWPLAGHGGLNRNFRQSFDATFDGWKGAWRLWRLRLCVATSTGDVFRQKPEKELLQLFKKLAKKKDVEDGSPN